MKFNNNIVKTIVVLITVIVVIFLLSLSLSNSDNIINSQVSEQKTLTKSPVIPKIVRNHSEKSTINQRVTGDINVDHTIILILKGGPFPYPNRDGVPFFNREKRLPVRPRGYYHEYTVPTPGENTRGARRIVTGGHPPTEFYYSKDHYRTFTKLNVPLN